MNTTSVIEIGTFEAFVGIATMLISIGIAWGMLKSQVSSIKAAIDEDIRPEIKALRKDLHILTNEFKIVQDRVETMWNRLETSWKDRVAPASSPRQLNELGENILENSGIKEVIDKYKNELFTIVKEKAPSNPYDAENLILETVDNLPQMHPELIDQLKEGAFLTGENLDSVLFIGGIYLRNLIFEDLGFLLPEEPKS